MELQEHELWSTAIGTTAPTRVSILRNVVFDILGIIISNLAGITEYIILQLIPQLVSISPEFCVVLFFPALCVLPHTGLLLPLHGLQRGISKNPTKKEFEPYRSGLRGRPLCLRGGRGNRDVHKNAVAVRPHV